ncbi:MAG TPA: sulfatase [Phycisphaerae bacterium]|nr:sulfatase [Phycisphaerae bacterium]
MGTLPGSIRRRRSSRGPAPSRLSRRECLASFLPFLVCPSRVLNGAPARPNILFIMIDTLRSDHVACYGYSKPTTPNLDRLAREGVRFATFRSASPWTMPSLMTMFSSLHPTVHGATNYQRRASLKVPTLAERLKRLGYARTVGIVGNPTVNSRYGFAQGFDVYDDYTIFFAHELGVFDAAGAERPRSVVDSVTSQTVTRMGAEWLTKHRTESPWFLFLLYFDPHSAYVPPPPWHRKFDPHPDAPGRNRAVQASDLMGKKVAPDRLEHVVALYDGEIGYTDHCIGALLARLDALGLRDDTLVVVVSDHGEEFLDHGGFLHGRSLYEELTRAVLLLRCPGRLPAGKVVSVPAAHLDLTPTLLECVGEKPDPECQGVSRLPQMLGAESGRPAADPEPCFLEGATKESLRAVILGRHKLIRDVESGQEELYDLDADPGERNNTAVKQPDVCAKLRGVLKSHVDQCSEAAKRYQIEGEGARPQLTRRDIETLRALGYLQ